jgi:hypothetical protein
VPPRQAGVVGPYPVWGIWVSSRLPLEGTGLYPDFLGRNQWPTVPGVQDLDKYFFMSSKVCGYSPPPPQVKSTSFFNRSNGANALIFRDKLKINRLK